MRGHQVEVAAKAVHIRARHQREAGSCAPRVEAGRLETRKPPSRRNDKLTMPLRNSAEEKGHQHVCAQEKEEAKVTEERSEQPPPAKYQDRADLARIGDEVRKGGQTPMSEHSTKDRASFQELVR